MKRIEEKRYEDPWYMSLGKDARLLFDYLICRSDSGGFVKVNEAVWCRDALLSSSECLKALESLSKPFKGVKRVFKRLDKRSGEEVVWLKNFVKVQAGKTNGFNANNNWDKGILKIFGEMGDLFPEVFEAYEVAKLLKELKSSSKCSKEHRERREEKRSSLTLEKEDKSTVDKGNTTGGGDVPAYLTEARRLIAKMKAEGAGCHSSISEAALGKLVRDRPDIDWEAVTDKAIGVDLNEGVGNTYSLMSKMSLKADFIKGRGAGAKDWGPGAGPLMSWDQAKRQDGEDAWGWCSRLKRVVPRAHDVMRSEAEINEILEKCPESQVARTQEKLWGWWGERLAKVVSAIEEITYTPLNVDELVAQLQELDKAGEEER